MPTSVIVAVVSSYVATAVVGTTIAGFVISALASQVIGAIAGQLVGMAFSGVFSDSSSDGGGGQQQNFEQELRDNLVTVRQPITHWQYIYGRDRVGGALTFAHESADDNFHLVITYAGHACDAIEAIQFSDEVVPLDGSGNATGKYAGFVRIHKSLGDEAGQPFSSLVAESEGKWTDAHRQSGRTKIYVRLTPNTDLFPMGLPNITAVIRGKKVYNPRTDVTAWTDNASLCQSDFLCDPHAGLAAVYADEIDEAQLIAAANLDDEDVALAAGGTENRYTLNGSFSVNSTPREILGRLLSANAGKVRYIGGLFCVEPAAYVTPTITLTEADCRAVPVITPRLSASDLANGVKGVYVSEGNLWQATDFPAVTNATYLAEDEGERSWRELDLPFTKSVATAQRIAKIDLERLRQQIGVEWKGKFNCYRLQPGNTVRITFSMLGWSEKVFEVTQAGLVFEEDDDGMRLGCNLTLRETASTVFDWSSGEETVVDAAPDTNLPDPFTVAAPGAPAVTEALYETRDGRGVAAKATMSWGVAADAFVVSYQPEYKLAAAAAYTVLPRTSDLVIEILDIAPGLYEFREKAINTLGVSSAYSAVTTKEITGLSAEPEAAVILGLQAVGGLAILTLEPHPALDVRRGGRWLVRHSEDSILWEDSFSIGQEEGYVGDQTILVLPLKAGTYLVKPEDSTGHTSSAAVTITTKQASVHAFSTIATLTEEPVFAGTHDGTLVAGGNLQLTAAGLFDDIPDFDAIGSLDAYGGILPSGSYTFATGFDFGAVSRRRITGQLRGQTVNILDSIDERTENIDAWLNFDGTGGGGSTDAWIEYRETDDDPTVAPTWSEWKRLDAAEVEAWGVQCRLRVVSTDAAYNQYVDKLGAIAEEVV